MGQAERILVVDDSEGDTELIARALAEVGLEARTAHGVLDAQWSLAHWCPRAVLTDWRLEGDVGAEVLEFAARHCPDVPLVVISGAARPDDVQRARALGAALVLAKPEAYGGYLEIANRIRDLVRERRAAGPDAPLDEDRDEPRGSASAGG